MDKNIISFNLAKQRRDKQRGSPPMSSLNSTQLDVLPDFIELECDLLIKGLRSKKLKYKYPTILSGYRKEINPVDALYQNLQESLFKYDPNNEFCMWVISLFEDDEWLSELIKDLEIDCANITQFQIRYRVSHKFRTLHDIKHNFQHYIKFFNLMRGDVTPRYIVSNLHQ